MELPVQPVINQRPFSVLGWLLAAVILLLVVLSYLKYKKKPAMADWYQQTTSHL
jgi:hypothetical protein